jgi:hypothetical protein
MILGSDSGCRIRLHSGTGGVYRSNVVEDDCSLILKEELKKGLSYPAAASKAFSHIFKGRDMLFAAEKQAAAS